ncbi:hypothetical protein [Dyadobacter sp. NIV53]|uniref:hypothetical protein n=1 Tax=Dyadobacter sp. NIV53 TaxID=2861765 RepID=UPI001C8734FC|nr:hypothetical protein [Dyadobacter sp. NIV53]
MEEPFIIDVNYGGKELEFEGQLHISGYQHKIEIIVNEIPVFFEPDEERNYRALVSMEQMQHHKHMSQDLLQAIAHRLDSLLT